MHLTAETELLAPETSTALERLDAAGALQLGTQL